MNTFIIILNIIISNKNIEETPYLYILELKNELLKYKLITFFSILLKNALLPIKKYNYKDIVVNVKKLLYVKLRNILSSDNEIEIDINIRDMKKIDNFDTMNIVCIE